MTESSNLQNVTTPSTSNDAQIIQQNRKAMAKGLINIGVRLAEAAKHHDAAEWKERVRTEYGYTPTQSAQLIRIGKSLGQYLDTPTFEALPDLPEDSFKLDWVSRLPIDEMGELLESMDCRASSPREVMHEVQRRQASAKVLKAWDKFKGVVIEAAQTINSDVLAQLREDLSSRFDELDVILSETTSPDEEDDQPAQE
jgi:hypothetical protein